MTVVRRMIGEAESNVLNLLVSTFKRKVPIRVSYDFI
jgi:hypothetical protein